MSRNPLPPERHTTRDFFIADIFDALPVKDDRHTMEHPFFTLSTKKDLRSIKYERNGVKVVVSPSHNYGLPTMFDKDILLYCGSLVVAELNKNPGERPPQTLRFSCHDLLITTNRETNGKSYKLLKNAFERLNGVSVSTNVETAGIKESAGFHLIEKWHVIENSHEKSRMVKVEVKLSDWFYRALIGREVLTINRDYFRLRKPTERRMYELARKHCGNQEQWKISLTNLKEKCGAQSLTKYFRASIKEIIAANTRHQHFPDYGICLSDMDVVTFTNLDTEKHQSRYPLRMSEKATALCGTLKGGTLERGQDIVIQSGTGWDYRAIIEEFTAYLQKKGAPDKLNGAFIGFVRKKTAKAP